MVSAANHDRILRLRVKCGYGEDPLSLRLRASAMLGGARLHPSRLPPAAILFVRRLRDPLPGLAPPRILSARPPLAWERALEGEMDRLAQVAARPARGENARGAPAVVFQDWAEAWACFLRDVLEGRASEGWWWEGLLGSGPRHGSPALEYAARRLAESPADLPAVIALLQRSGHAAAFLEAVPEETVGTLARALMESFGGTFVAPLFVEVEAAVRERALALTQPRPIRSGPVARQVQVLLGSPPWTTDVGTPDPWQIEPSKEAFRAIASELQRRPAFVLNGSLLRQVQRWRRELVEWTAVLQSDSHEEGASGGQPALPAPAAAGGAQLEQNPLPSESAVAARAQEPAQRSYHIYTCESVAPEFAPGPGSLGPAAIEEAAPSSAEPPPGGPSTLPPLQTEAAVQSPVETSCGGVFYLLHLALAWNLYGDFTRPSQPCLALPVWDFLALLGPKILNEPNEADPLWRLFARLAGRAEDSIPGEDFDPPADVSLDPDLPPPADPGVSAWFDWVAACAARKLQAALGDSFRDALREPAHVWVTETRVDVVFALEVHPIELRLSGLDRDPGWIPAAARHVAFHYQ